MYFYDTETIGFHGLAVLIQYAKDNGEVKIHDVWERKIGETLDLIEELMDNTVVGYNLAFDHFHLSKLYTTFSLLDRSDKPESIIHEVYLAEEQGRFGKCIKPTGAVDLMVEVRRSKFQAGMGKYRWVIKKVHKSIVKRVVDYLNYHTSLELKGYLHRSDEPIWHSEIIENKRNEWIEQDFRNVVGSIKPSTGLKSICAEIFNMPVHYFQEVMPPKHYQPVELGYIPYAKGIVDMDGWPTEDPPPQINKEYKGTWPLYINLHKLHWKRSLPRKYAAEDVIWTRKLYDYFCNEYGQPVSESVDSALTCCVASCRWRGYDLDVERLRELRNDLMGTIDTRIIPYQAAQRYLLQAMNNFEAKVYMEEPKLEGGTSKPVLTQLAKWKILCDECLEAENLEGCENCQPHEVAIRAKKIMAARKSNAKLKTFNKLLLSTRFHPSFIVPGTKSNRMSGGGGGLNPQGIDRTNEMRRCFTLANKELGQVLEGGDFEGFELTICDAVYKDPNWRKMLESGKSVHAEFGTVLFDMTYDEIMSTKGQPGSKYDSSKSGDFLLLYGGDRGGLEYKLEVPAKKASTAEQKFFIDYPAIAKRREEIYKQFRPLRDDFSWSDPKEYIESFMGYRRYFTVEWTICRILFMLNHTTAELVESARESNSMYNSDSNLMCERVKGRRQTPENALRSALLGCIKKVQKKCSRAAINHEIQSPGADATKAIQKALWDLQPCGINDWVIQPMNVHDEIPCVVHDPDLGGLVEETVQNKVKELQGLIPLLKMSWGSGDNWKDIH